jgi:hypothetical protein
MFRNWLRSRTVHRLDPGSKAIASAGPDQPAQTGSATQRKPLSLRARKVHESVVGSPRCNMPVRPWRGWRAGSRGAAAPARGFSGGPLPS